MLLSLINAISWCCGVIRRMIGVEPRVLVTQFSSRTAPPHSSVAYSALTEAASAVTAALAAVLLRHVACALPPVGVLLALAIVSGVRLFVNVEVARHRVLQSSQGVNEGSGFGVRGSDRGVELIAVLREHPAEPLSLALDLRAGG